LWHGSHHFDDAAYDHTYEHEEVHEDDLVAMMGANQELSTDGEFIETPAQQW